MNILYISQTDIRLDSYSIYSDFAKAIKNKGHELTILCASSNIKKDIQESHEGIEIIRIKVENQFGANLIKKAFIILSLKQKMKRAIKKYLGKKNFDIVVYFTPPITFAGAVEYCKNKFKCKSYLILKDIFPQNAVDLKMLKTSGLKGIIYNYFRKQEKKLYKLSDRIGCMSKMNMSYILEKNPYISASKVEYFPNSAIIRPYVKSESKEKIESLGIDKNKLVFIYGGNLGKPQGLNHFIECLKACEYISDVHFIVVGKGSEKELLFKEISKIKNVTTLNALPAEEYNILCNECDVGLVLLDKNFTIPNFPSRMLSYMANAKPMLACVDRNNDVPDLIKDANCGNYCYSDHVNDFVKMVEWFLKNKSRLKELGNNGRKYFEQNFNVENYIVNLEKLMEEKL